MSHTIRLTFGPIVSIEITRDSKRRVTHIHTFFNQMLEGYQLDTNPDTQEGTFRPIPSTSVGERYFEGRIHFPPVLGEKKEPVSVSYISWIRRCIQQSTAWARAAGTSAAHDSVAAGDFDIAAETYRDVLDHFPPPPDSALLNWLYFCCVAHLEGIDEAREGLLSWFQEALQMSGMEAVGSVLQPARELLGDTVSREFAENWLEQSSPHDPAHKMTRRWLSRVGENPSDRSKWSVSTGKPFLSKNSPIVCCPDGSVVVAGGSDVDGRPSALAARWNPKTDVWSPLPALPEPRKNHALVAMWDNSIIAIGGCIETDNSDSRFTNSVVTYLPEEDKWVHLPSLKIGRENLSAIVVRGRVVVVGGETPLQTKSLVEVWDRRENAWLEGPNTGVRLKNVHLAERNGLVLISGSSVSSSGTGALLVDLRENLISPANGLRGIGVDGLYPLSSGEVMVWAKRAGELNIGIWSPERRNVNWTCSEIPIPQRDDLLQILPCDDDQFLLLYVRPDNLCGARIIHPEKGFVDDIDPLAGEDRPETLSAITLADGRVLVTDHNNSSILST